MTRRNTDEDTETGLPRKTMAKLGLWSVRALIACGIWYCGQQIMEMKEETREIRREMTEMNVRLSRIEGKVNMVANDTGELLAATPLEAQPMP